VTRRRHTAPRYAEPDKNAGPTAVIEGLAVWFFVGLLHAIGESPMAFMPEGEVEIKMEGRSDAAPLRCIDPATARD